MSMHDQLELQLQAVELFLEAGIDTDREAAKARAEQLEKPIAPLTYLSNASYKLQGVELLLQRDDEDTYSVFLHVVPPDQAHPHYRLHKMIFDSSRESQYREYWFEWYSPTKSWRLQGYYVTPEDSDTLM